MNRATLIGRLGANPESKTLSSGQTLCNFTLATSDKWTDRDGQKQEKTEWHKITVWGSMAVTCERFLSKGRQVAVEGKIQTRSWEDQQGVKRYTTEIVATNVEFLGDKSESKPADFGAEPSFDSNDEIPF